MDIRASSAGYAASGSIAVTTGKQAEGVAQTKRAEDTFQEKKEAEKSDPGANVGRKVDISA